MTIFFTLVRGIIATCQTMEQLAVDSSADGQRPPLAPTPSDVGTGEFAAFSRTDPPPPLAPIPSDVGTGEFAAFSRTDPPPPYAITPDSTTRAMLHSLTNRMPELTDATSDEVERLRNFLLHCLTTDYEIKYIPKLSSADTTHFLRLGQSLSDIMSINGRYPDLAEPGEQLWYFLDRFIFGPAGVLDIPISPVVSMICLFRTTISYGRSYEGAWESIHYVHMLAEKLLIDRDVMITAVVPATNPYLRRKLLRARDEMQEEYFVSLTDTKTFTLTEGGMVFQKSLTCSQAKYGHMFGKLSPQACHTKISELVGIFKFLNFFRRKGSKHRRNE